MSKKRVGLEQELVEEFGRAEFGDERLSRRVEKIARAAIAQPAKSFPQQARDDAALEATYRALNNPHVTPERILAPHVAATVARCAERKRTIVAHDTTECAFEGRDELGYLSGEKRGFLGQFALAISADETREPFGVLHVEAVVREGEPGQRKRGSKESLHESQRWNRVAKTAHELLGEIEAIHVLDSEADNYGLMAEMAARGQQFVVRACYDRRTEDGLISELLEGARVQAVRTVKISARKKNKGEPGRKRHPARAGREAKLEISSATMLLRRNGKRHKGAPETLQLNLVRAIEVGAPEGETPTEWRLWTTLPISTREEVLAVIDAYRARWVIEEYFKALKTGCAFEERQLESPKSMLNALAVFAPVAWLLLRLRTRARTAGNEPQRSLSETQLACLRFLLMHFQKYQLPQNPTEQQTLTALARHGGHITSNGDPGWQVLGRALHDVLTAELGYLAAKNI